MKCGQVCLTQYPFTDGTAAKLRPVLIVSLDEYNTGEDLVVLPISSRPTADDPQSVYIGSSSSSFSMTGLRQSSSVKWTKPLTISKAVITRRLGSLDPNSLLIVQEKLSGMFLK